MVKKLLENKHNTLSYLCVLLLLAFNTFAKDLGVVGHIFEIKEQDIAEIIATDHLKQIPCKQFARE